MKSDEDVRMISAEAPVLFAKACELFILDMALRYGPCADPCSRSCKLKNTHAYRLGE
jgi:hypothetical protein